MRICKICQHPNLQTINKRLKAKVPLRKICSEFPDITLTSLHRHKSKHLAFKHPKPALTPGDSPYSAVLQKVEQHLKIAEQKKQPKNILLFLKEKRTIISKIEDENKQHQDQAPLEQNLVETTEWISLRGKILDALDGHPEAKKAVVEAVKSF